MRTKCDRQNEMLTLTRYLLPARESVCSHQHLHADEDTISHEPPVTVNTALSATVRHYTASVYHKLKQSLNDSTRCLQSSQLSRYSHTHTHTHTHRLALSLHQHSSVELAITTNNCSFGSWQVSSNTVYPWIQVWVWAFCTNTRTVLD